MSMGLWFVALICFPTIVFCVALVWITHRADKRMWDEIDKEKSITEDPDYRKALKQLDKEFPGVVLREE
jgi:hypothetical protein